MTNKSNLLNFSMPDSVERTEDFIGREVLETGIYEMTLKDCFLDRSKGGAAFVNLEGTVVPEGGDGAAVPYSQRIFFTSGDSKGNLAFFEKNGKKYKMPCLATLDNLCEILTGKNLQNQDTEQKLVKTYENGNPVNKTMDILSDLTGQVVLVAIEKREENKREQNAAGDYVPTSETISTNEIRMFLTSNGHTYNEHVDGIQETQWKDNFMKRFAGKTRNLVKEVVGADKGQVSSSKPPLGASDNVTKI